MSKTELHFALSPEFIDVAEQARKRGQLNNAINIATSGLEQFTGPYKEDTLGEIANNPEQVAMLASLSRIYVDSLKSAANRSKFPREALYFLLRAAHTIQDIYDHPAIQKAVSQMSEDHVGRTHYFAPEMQRDKAKTAFAATVLYQYDKADKLTERGEKILFDTFLSLPDDHPVKPLISIEYHLSQRTRGKIVEDEVLLRDLHQILQTDLHDNPHRVATVASWLAALGIPEAEKIFLSIVEKHPEWKFMIEQEQRKLSINEKRKRMFQLLSPFTTSRNERDQLYTLLKHM